MHGQRVEHVTRAAAELRRPGAARGSRAEPAAQRLLDLQATAGNAAVAGLVQRDGEDAGADAEPPPDAAVAQDAAPPPAPDAGSPPGDAAAPPPGDAAPPPPADPAPPPADAAAPPDGAPPPPSERAGMPPAEEAARPGAPAAETTQSPPAPAAPAEIADVPSVPFTRIADDGRHVSDLPETPFGGLAEVERFANALADEYAARRRTQLAAAGLATRRREARSAAQHEHPAGERPRDRTARITAAIRAVQAPTAEELAAQVTPERTARFQTLTDDWARHQHSHAARGMTVSTIANAWMTNRAEQLLFDTVTQSRPRGQARMWTNLWIAPAAEGARPVDHDPTVGVPLTTAPNGRPGDGGALVDPRTITFLTALNGRFPNVSFGTYRDHGSGGFVGRGLSVDLTLTGRLGRQDRDRHFWVRQNVLSLLVAVDATAASLGYRFFAIYNDFAVAQAANAQVTTGNVGFAANIDAHGGLNYHGGGIKLHVHIDLVPPDLISTTRPPPRPRAPAAH